MECIVPWEQPMLTIFLQPLWVNFYLSLNVVIPAFRSSLLVLCLHILIYRLVRWLFFRKSPDVKINVRTPAIREILNCPSIFRKTVRGSVCYYHVCIIISCHITIHAVPQPQTFSLFCLPEYQKHRDVQETAPAVEYTNQCSADLQSNIDR